MLRPDASILLYEDGVYAALSGTVMVHKLRDVLDDVRVYCLKPDLAARGIEPEKVLAGIELVAYEGFVELCVEHRRVQAWL